MSGNEWCLSLIERWYSKNKYFVYVVFYFQLTKYAHNAHSKFDNYLVLIVHQATLHNKCSKYSPSESMHQSTCLITDCRTLLKVGWNWFSRQHFVGEVSLYLQVELHYFFHGTKPPSGPGPPHCWDFTITLRHATLSRYPLDEWLAWSTGLYLTTNTRERERERERLARLRRDSNP